MRILIMEVDSINNYEIEPTMSDWLKDNLNKYYPEIAQTENINDLYKLIVDYAIYICTDKDKAFKITENQMDKLIELLLKLCLSLSSRPALYESEYKYMKNNWKPDWEICSICSNRYTSRCNPSECNPLDI